MPEAEVLPPMQCMQSNDVPKKQPPSALKIEANRRNAAKSTGPKTPSGKANSRKNAIKHGLFVRHMQELPGETRQEFEEYLNRLWDDVEPVGPREENEVEYIAICWLKLQRLWRYENAEIMSDQRSVRRQAEIGGYNHLVGMQRPAKILSLLRAADAEFKATGQIPPALMERIFAEDADVKIDWPNYEARAQAVAKQNLSGIAKKISEDSNIPLSQARIKLAKSPMLQPEFARFVALETIRSVRSDLTERWNQLFSATVQAEIQLKAIPSSSRAMDKIFRYGDTSERYMRRAYARLERLQSLRKGEPVPPPVDISFTS